MINKLNLNCWMLRDCVCSSRKRLSMPCSHAPSPTSSLNSTSASMSSRNSNVRIRRLSSHIWSGSRRSVACNNLYYSSKKNFQFRRVPYSHIDRFVALTCSERRHYITSGCTDTDRLSMTRQTVIIMIELQY